MHSVSAIPFVDINLNVDYFWQNAGSQFIQSRHPMCFLYLYNLAIQHSMSKSFRMTNVLSCKMLTWQTIQQSWPFQRSECTSLQADTNQWIVAIPSYVPNQARCTAFITLRHVWLHVHCVISVSICTSPKLIPAFPKFISKY